VRIKKRERREREREKERLRDSLNLSSTRIKKFFIRSPFVIWLSLFYFEKGERRIREREKEIEKSLFNPD
jgi:hypothetical protein